MVPQATSSGSHPASSISKKVSSASLSFPTCPYVRKTMGKTKQNDNTVDAERKRDTNLQFHPSKEVPNLPPPFLLLEHDAHLSKAKLTHKRPHHHSHIILSLKFLGKSSHLLDSGHHMLTVQMAIPVILQVPNHLLWGPLDPLGGLRLRTLVPTQNAQILGSGLDNAASVIVRERLLGVP
ncbi:Pentatricopeptide repeat-containing protein [Senna tora]|uniref:Pentatricopeptide repeat-containing protein n=1 Tax=Senna tora TaxID=362788 RepID=A0A834X367_9FABA|nr:Pentatricopeptide repeat-containing protein [Senna tora]